jgi:hypothetical protein
MLGRLGLPLDGIAVELGLVPVVDAEVEAVVAATLAALTSASAGAVEVRGTAANTLGALASTSAGAVEVRGAVAAALAPLTGAAAGSADVRGVVLATLGALTADAEGEVVTLATTGTVAAMLAGLITNIAGVYVPVGFTGADGITYPIWRPQYGDPEINPRPRIMQPSVERFPFSLSGELLVDGPPLPEGFLRAPDIAKLPWRRKRGDEWTDAAFRAEVLAWLVPVLAARGNPRWQVTEKASKPRSGRIREDRHYLVVRIGAAEVAQTFPRSARSGAALAAKLAEIVTAIDAA